MKTGSHLKIKPMGSHVLGVELEGNPNNPEPDEFRVMFPGGDISVVRCTDGSYWAHIRVDHKEHQGFIPDYHRDARISSARLDIVGKFPQETNLGDFKDPDLYHVALKIEVVK